MAARPCVRPHTASFDGGADTRRERPPRRTPRGPATAHGARSRGSNCSLTTRRRRWTLPWLLRRSLLAHPLFPRLPRCPRCRSRPTHRRSYRSRPNYHRPCPPHRVRWSRHCRLSSRRIRRHRPPPHRVHLIRRRRPPSRRVRPPPPAGCAGCACRTTGRAAARASHARRAATGPAGCAAATGPARARRHVHEVADDDLDRFAIGGRIVEAPEVHPQRERLLRDVGGRIRGRVRPALDQSGHASHRLQIAEQRARDAAARPDEPRRRQRAAPQRERVAQLADGGSGRRVIGPVAVRSVRLAPPCVLDVDLVGAVGADAGRGPVREETEHDVLVVGVDGPVDLPLVGPKPQTIGGEELRGGPRSAVVRDPEVQVPAGVDRHVLRIAIADTRHGARGQLPGVALPGDRRALGRPRLGQPGGHDSRREERTPAHVQHSPRSEGRAVS